jgi:epoxyqueuosine reductase
MHPEQIKTLARECGFELAGIAAAAPAPEVAYYGQWIADGMAGEMGYLTDRRAGLRDDPRHLLPSARSILCVGKLYNGPQPYSTQFAGEDLAWISRYAWGEDYHQVLRRGLARVVDGLRALSEEPFEWKICVDTAPLLERAYARHAGLGWIAKNTCLISRRPTVAARVRGASTRARPRPSCPPAWRRVRRGRSIRGCASRTSPLSCAARRKWRRGPPSGATSSVAIFVRMSAHGTGARP